MSTPPHFWIDVGGTFTDCIAVTPDGRLRQHKTLSSGITKGTCGHGSTPGQVVDGARCADPPGFWNGSTIRLGDTSGHLIAETRVTDFDAADGILWMNPALPAHPGLRYEIDPGLPAPVLGIRWLLRLGAKDMIPPVEVRFGTTRGTNALLTRTGARTALITTKGFCDVPLIGNQDRPKLFDLDIRKPEPLFETVVEVNERISSDGTVLTPLDHDHARRELQRLYDDGIESLAICLMHAWIRPQHEIELRKLAQDIGFREVSHSFDVSPQIRFVPRCDTTVLDAYLNPVLRSYLGKLRNLLPGSRVLVMTSIGGLVDSSEFRGRDSILSGPAGGIVGFSAVARLAGFERAIGFDMGGTSTDVARFGGRFDYEQETTKAGVRVLTPMLAIETVAAGGGSVCGFDGVRLHVGPKSAGATPGPACYGSGGPLTVTDLNVFLGRVIPEHFPFTLDVAAIENRLTELSQQMQAASAWPSTMSLESLAAGLLQIANDNMVHAIRRVSVAKGYDPADHVLVSFGGAGGQHACSVARALGIRRVLLHPFAGILSAWGMGQADIRCRRTTTVLRSLTEDSLECLQATINSLAFETRQHVAGQGIPDSQIDDPEIQLELRYVGTESTLPILPGTLPECRARFEAEHERLFGYLRSDRSIEIEALRVETTGRLSTPDFHSTNSENHHSAAIPHAIDNPGTRSATPSVSTWFTGHRMETSVFIRDELSFGQKIPGPAIICESTSTILVEPDCVADVLADGCLLVTVNVARPPSSGLRPPSPSAEGEGQGLPDPVLLEVFSNQFASIAEQMGATLRRTSVSTNVRERLDYSCALFDSPGKLVVNAPHVPVHLGAMGETVRAIIEDHPDMQPGDVFVTNDPFRGGSHLPDVTVVTPVFVKSPCPAFFVANRAHHAEIGGIQPGSMPPFSKRLAEEGIVIRSRRLVRAGESLESELRELLSSGPFPSRAVDDNLADLAAQAAANARGVTLLQSLCAQHSAEGVELWMRHVRQAAERKMRRALQRLENGTVTFSDQLDDGTVIQVAIDIHGDRATVDFTGTAGVHARNFNANRAITTAAVLYAFRCLLNEDVPLNAGVLEPLTLIISPGLLNPEPGTSPEESPAVVGGNVETSQRIVDVLLGALGLAAASQGTMNNLTFGNDKFGYYETIGGGAGATPRADGADAVHTHMTNTRLTDPEILEQRFPVRLRQFGIRRGSGGSGRYRGGDGIVREIEFLAELHVSMLSERRSMRPWGLNDGTSGAAGINQLSRSDNDAIEHLDGAFSRTVKPGDTLRILTPGGGGWGRHSRQ